PPGLSPPFPTRRSSDLVGPSGSLDQSRPLCFPSRSVPIPAHDGSGSLPGSKRNVVLYPLFHAPDLLDQVGEIGAVLDEVDEGDRSEEHTSELQSRFDLV